MKDYKQEIDEIKKQMLDLNTGITAALAVSDHRTRTKNIIIGVLLALLIMSNGAWFMYERQFETGEETTETVTITQDNESGFNNYIGNDGDIINGDTNN